MDNSNRLPDGERPVVQPSADRSAAPESAAAKAGKLTSHKVKKEKGGGIGKLFKGIFSSSSSSSAAAAANPPSLSAPSASSSPTSAASPASSSAAAAAMAANPLAHRVEATALPAVLPRQRVASPPPDPRILAQPLAAPRSPWNFTIKTPSSSKIAKATPQELLEWSAMGANITGQQFLTAANTFSARFSRESVADPSIGTMLHTLYEKAAEKFMVEGKFALAFQARTQALQNVPINPHHQLFDLNRAIADSIGRQADPSHGAHFSNLDSGSLKGGHLRIDRRNVEGHMTDCFQMRLSEHARRDLQASLSGITTNWEAFLASLPPELQGGATITRVPHVFRGKTDDGVFTSHPSVALRPGRAEAIQIEFQGVGKIIIGDTKEVGCLYNEVTVEIPSNLPPGQGLSAVHQMLTVIGGGSIMGIQSPMDDERMRLAQLYRAYFPSAANKLERSKEFYELSIGALREVMNIRSGGKFQAVLARVERDNRLMSKVEVYPGQQVWSVNDISSQMRAKGAIGLMAGVGYRGGIRECAPTIAHILRAGSCSSQDRFQGGAVGALGGSSEEDLAKGGGDRVFTRLINHQTVSAPISSILFSGNVQVLYDLEVVNRGAYAYDADKYGLKNPCVQPPEVNQMESYEFNYGLRPNLMDFTEESSNPGNEVMLRNRVGPEFIRGLVVKDENAQTELIECLRDPRYGVIITKSGVDYIKVGAREVPAREFIKISKTTFNPGMWG